MRPGEVPGAAPADAIPREVWLWLANALGPAAPNAAGVLDLFPDPRDLLRARFSQDLSALVTPGQLQALQQTNPARFAPVLARCRDMSVVPVCWDEAAYPELLRQIPSPPPVLFCRGDTALLNAPFTFAMVGTRRPSAYGVEATAKIARCLAETGAVLVSGMADGLDGESHKAALQAGAPTIACIAFGHDCCYPARNRKLKELIERHGLTVSEYPPGTQPQRNYFLQRNRLIAGLSRGVCVAEARRQSGTMNTVAQALDFGRDVFSVPGNIFSPLCEGTNRLLVEGAVPATCGEDILAHYGLQLPGTEDADGGQEEHAPPAVPLTEDARILRGALTFQPQGLDGLCAATGLPPGRAMAALTNLELAGISAQVPGRQFLLK